MKKKFIMLNALLFVFFIVIDPIRHGLNNNNYKNNSSVSNDINSPGDSHDHINTNYKGNTNDIINNAISRQQKIDEERKDKVKVIVNNDTEDMDQNSILNYGYTITYNDYHNGTLNETSQSVDGSKEFGRRERDGTNSNIYYLGQNDPEADKDKNMENSYISLSELFNIKIHINVGPQPNSKVTLDSKYKQLIEYQALMSARKPGSIYYSIEGVGILTCPAIYLVEHWTDSKTGKDNSVRIGQYNVYNFCNTNGAWAITLSCLASGVTLSALSVLGLILGAKAARMFARFWANNNVLNNFVDDVAQLTVLLRGDPRATAGIIRAAYERLFWARGENNNMNEDYDVINHDHQGGNDNGNLRNDQMNREEQGQGIVLPARDGSMPIVSGSLPIQTGNTAPPIPTLSTSNPVESMTFELPLPINDDDDEILPIVTEDSIPIISESGTESGSESDSQNKNTNKKNNTGDKDSEEINDDDDEEDEVIVIIPGGGNPLEGEDDMPLVEVTPPGDESILGLKDGSGPDQIQLQLIQEESMYPTSDSSQLFKDRMNRAKINIKNFLKNSVNINNQFDIAYGQLSNLSDRLQTNIEILKTRIHENYNKLNNIKNINNSETNIYKEQLKSAIKRDINTYNEIASDENKRLVNISLDDNNIITATTASYIINYSIKLINNMNQTEHELNTLYYIKEEINDILKSSDASFLENISDEERQDWEKLCKKLDNRCMSFYSHNINFITNVERSQNIIYKTLNKIFNFDENKIVIKESINEAMIINNLINKNEILKLIKTNLSKWIDLQHNQFGNELTEINSRITNNINKIRILSLERGFKNSNQRAEIIIQKLNEQLIEDITKAKSLYTKLKKSLNNCKVIINTIDNNAFKTFYNESDTLIDTLFDKWGIKRSCDAIKKIKDNDFFINIINGSPFYDDNKYVQRFGITWHYSADISNIYSAYMRWGIDLIINKNKINNLEKILTNVNNISHTYDEFHFQYLNDDVIEAIKMFKILDSKMIEKENRMKHIGLGFDRRISIPNNIKLTKEMKTEALDEVTTQLTEEIDDLEKFSQECKLINYKFLQILRGLEDKKWEISDYGYHYNTLDNILIEISKLKGDEKFLESLINDDYIIEGIDLGELVEVDAADGSNSKKFIKKPIKYINAIRSRIEVLSEYARNYEYSLLLSEDINAAYHMFNPNDLDYCILDYRRRL